MMARPERVPAEEVRKRMLDAGRELAIEAGAASPPSRCSSGRGPRAPGANRAQRLAPPRPASLRPSPS